MGKALEIIAGIATAPGATVTAMVAQNAQSFTVRNFDNDKKAFLIGAWCDNQAIGLFQIRSPKLHDNVRGIRWNVPAGIVHNLIPDYIDQTLYAQDTLIVENTGSATAGDIQTAVLAVYYEDLPGAQARLFTLDEVNARLVNIFNVQCSIVAAAGGGFTGSQAINASIDLFKGNTDYAILGYIVDVECAAVGMVGPDWANLRIGGPGDNDPQIDTARWFINLSNKVGEGCIPVFNSANKTGTFISVATDENVGTFQVTLICAELK